MVYWIGFFLTFILCLINILINTKEFTIRDLLYTLLWSIISWLGVVVMLIRFLSFINWEKILDKTIFKIK